MTKFRYAPPPHPATTKRDLSWKTEGAEIARVARLMGFELMPWQRYVVDVATEYRIIGPGESESDLLLGQRGYHYGTVQVTVPRQSGKSTLLGPVRVHRMMTRPKFSGFSTAQTGNDAGKRMQGLIKQVNESPLSPLFKPRFSIGSEGLALPSNGAKLTRFSPVPSAIHGETPHWVDYDEYWKYSLELGEELVGAVAPAMAVLHGVAQRWFVSTMGTALSGFMNDMVDRGRSGEAGMAYFEWSMPDGLDPYDPDTWWAFHPALGNTIGVDALRAETKMPYAHWMRGYMNRKTMAVDALIEAEAFAALTDTFDEEAPAWKDIVVAYEVAPNGESAAVYGVWRDAAGNPCTHVIHAAPGTVWLADLLHWISTTRKPLTLAADDGGETRAVTDDLTRRGIDVYMTGMRDFNTACMGLLTAARDDKTLRHDGSETLQLAVMHAVQRSTGDQWRFSRKYSTGPIAALIAVAVGLWAFDHRETPIGSPFVY